MAAGEPPKFLLSAAELAAAPQVHVRHPFNPNSEVHLRSLGRPVGLKRLSLSLARVPRGRESFIYHAHEHDEEFVYMEINPICSTGRTLIISAPQSARYSPYYPACDKD